MNNKNEILQEIWKEIREKIKFKDPNLSYQEQALYNMGLLHATEVCECVINRERIKEQE